MGWFSLTYGWGLVPENWFVLLFYSVVMSLIFPLLCGWVKSDIVYKDSQQQPTESGEE